MDVFISGAAGRAVFVKGTEVFYVNLDRPTEKSQIGDGRLVGAAVCRALAESPDMRRLSRESEQEGMLALLAESNKDSALRIFEIALDFEDDPDFALDATAELERLIGDEETYSFLCNYVFAVPYDQPLDKTKRPSQAAAYPRSFHLIGQVIDAQSAIARVREAWSKILVGRFATLQEAAAVENTVVEAGGFKRLCDLLIGQTTLDPVVFDLHVATSRVRGHRELISAWLDALGIHADSRKTNVTYNLGAVARADEAFEEPRSKSSALAGEAEGVKFQRVTEQKAAIIQRLERDDVANAQRFTQELIADQIGAGDPEFAAKTLCSLAQEAKHLGYVSLQLEWTLKATEVYADDPWPFAQAGDAFLSLYRYDEASEYFDLALARGDYHYGRMGKARIAMLTGRPEEALQAFEQLAVADPGHQDAVLARIGMGDTQCSIGKLQEALAIYEQAASQYPDRDEPLCEKASVLRQLGRLDEALEIYTQVSEMFGKPMKAIIGQGEVHRAAGDFDAALAVYDEVIQRFPAESYPVIGRAQVLREAGHLEDALEAFEAAKVRFENNPHAYGGWAQTLRDLKRLPEALKAFEDAVERFPYEAYLRNGRASVTKRMGRLEEALKAYDENCRAFPYNLHALIGRVQLLKEFEQLGSALEAVENMIERHPDARYAPHLKASILALQGHYDEAMQLLPTGRPRTIEEWRGHHISCMIRLRRGDLDGAIEELQLGLTQNPFHRSKVYYQNALAAAELRRGRYEAAREAAAAGSGAAAELVTLQLEAALGNTETAVASLRVLEADPHDNVVYLAREIGRQYGFDSTPPQHDEIWVANRNAEIIMALAA